MQLVETRAALAAMGSRLDRVARFHVDTEFESTRRGVELCLVQIATGDEVFVVDALRLPDLSPLAPTLGDPARTWVLHAGGQDVPLLLRALGIERAPALFDTQVAWALVSAEPAVALGYLLYKVLGVRAVKAHQADDWKRRPLPRGQLAYAAADVAHLPALHAELARRAAALGRLDVVAQASAEQWTEIPEPPAPLSLSAFRHAWQLDAPAQAALRALLDWHQGRADRGGEPSLDAKALFAVASRMPQSTADLARIKGVPRGLVERRGAELVELVKAARAAPGRLVPLEPEPYVTFEEIAAEAWVGLVRAEACAAVQVAPDLAFPPRLVRRASASVRAAGDPLALLDALGGWRGALLEGALRDAIARRPLPVVVAPAGR